MGNSWPQLHLLLAGPFVLRDDGDGFRVLIPDLMDTHFNPGFTATNNAAELGNGIWTVSFTGYRSAGKPPVNTDGHDFDKFWRHRLPCSSAFATVKLPTPDLVYGLSPANALISSDTEDLPDPDPQRNIFATRAVLIYDSVDPSTIDVTPALNWNSPATNNKPDVKPIGANAAVLTLDMQPLVAPTSEEHAMMAYRNMAKMVGVNRFMRQGSAISHQERELFKGKYNDCGAPMMLITPPFESTQSA